MSSPWGRTMATTPWSARPCPRRWNGCGGTTPTSNPLCYDRAMTTGPTDIIAASILPAAELMRHGRWQQAEAILTQLLAAHPGEPDGLQLLGLVRENQSALAEAEQLLRQSLVSRPNQPH